MCLSVKEEKNVLDNAWKSEFLSKTTATKQVYLNN